MILFPKEKIGVIFLSVKRPYRGACFTNVDKFVTHTTACIMMTMMMMMLYCFDTYDDADDELTSSHPEYSKQYVMQSLFM